MQEEDTLILLVVDTGCTAGSYLLFLFCMNSRPPQKSRGHILTPYDPPQKCKICLSHKISNFNFLQFSYILY